MGFQLRLLIACILLLALPLTVSVITWQGLKSMDHELLEVAEEFSESRSLQPVDIELAVAAYALQQDSPESTPRAMASLREAERLLLQYLADQYNDVSDEEHQAEESSQASAALQEIRDLLGPSWETFSTADRLRGTNQVRSVIRDLYADAEEGVLRAPVSAKAARRRTLTLVVVSSIVCALICVGFLIWSSREVFRRLRELRNAMASDAENTPTQPARDVPGVMAQLEELNRRLHDKIEEKNREILRRERMAGIGLLAADVAHEINNPLNAMLGLSELSLRAASEPVDEQTRAELHESLGVIRREVIRCRGITQRLMAMVRGSKPPQWLDVMRLITETTDVARAARPDRAQCFVVSDLDRSIRLHTSSEELRQILLTLLINAADAVSQDGRIEIDAQDTGSEIWIRVRDNGRGFTAETQSRFAIPFSSTKHEEGGLGLGLSIAYAIAEDIGAEIRSQSEGPGHGSLFTIAFSSQESDS